MQFKSIIGHVLFWCIIMLTYAVSEWGYRDNFKEAMLFEWLFLPIRVVAVYLNWFLLIPKLLYQNKIIRYLIILTLALFIFATIQRYAAVHYIYPTYFPDWTFNTKSPLQFFRIIQYLVLIAPPVAFSTGIKLFIDWNRQKNRSKQLEIEKRNAELKYLKSQINPHFLFNTLNNLYGLSTENSKKVPSLIVKLSDFLSYSLYESDVDQTKVSKEIKMIKDFVDLESERYEERVKVDWKLDESLYEEEIASLLFMPLVENAFKHGVREETKQATVNIQLNRADQWLVFQVQNTLSSEEETTNSSGIGLANLRRRLELLYPDKHQLTIDKGEIYFTAILKIALHG